MGVLATSNFPVQCSARILEIDKRNARQQASAECLDYIIRISNSAPNAGLKNVNIV